MESGGWGKFRVHKSLVNARGLRLECERVLPEGLLVSVLRMPDKHFSEEEGKT